MTLKQKKNKIKRMFFTAGSSQFILFYIYLAESRVVFFSQKLNQNMSGKVKCKVRV